MKVKYLKSTHTAEKGTIKDVSESTAKILEKIGIIEIIKAKKKGAKK